MYFKCTNSSFGQIRYFVENNENSQLIKKYDILSWHSWGQQFTLISKWAYKAKKKKVEIPKCANNIYAWHDVGERKCRLIESLSRVLKYNWLSHKKENRRNSQGRARKYKSWKHEEEGKNKDTTEVKIRNIFA